MFDRLLNMSTIHLLALTALLAVATVLLVLLKMFGFV